MDFTEQLEGAIEGGRERSYVLGGIVEDQVTGREVAPHCSGWQPPEVLPFPRRAPTDLAFG